MPVRVALIALDQAVRSRLCALIGDTDKLRLVTSHENFKAAARELAQARPRVTVVGSKLFLISGVQCLKTLRALVPDMRLLMLGTSPDSEPFLIPLLVGAAGYVLNSAPSEELARAVLEVAQGGVFLCQEAQQAVVEYFGRIAAQGTPIHLTPRQQEICLLLGIHTEKEIAEVIHLSLGTVHSHVKAVYRKLEIHSRGELIRRLAQGRAEE